jgi:hypothetical protein
VKSITVISNRHGKKKILVDDKWFSVLNKHTWCVQKCGGKLYATRKQNRTENIVMHRFILGVTDSKVYVDHIDGNGLNNQTNNLRISNHSENL